MLLDGFSEIGELEIFYINKKLLIGIIFAVIECGFADSDVLLKIEKQTNFLIKKVQVLNLS